MNKVTGKLRKYDGIIFCFLASVLIAAISLNLGLLIEPGKILPTELSMRNEPLNKNMLRGIELALEDISDIKNGNSSDVFRLLSFVHADPFFYLALIFPQKASKAVLLLGYYVRFGVCCSAMYYFMSEHIKLSRLPAALLAVMYTFSSQLIFTAQVSSIMNMAIMFPVVMSSFDSYLKNRTWKTFLLVVLSSFVMCLTGGYGIMTGVPVLVFIGLLMSVSLYRSAKLAMSSWLKLLGGLVTGLALDAFAFLPGLLSMNPTGFADLEESVSKAEMKYTIFDVIKGSFLLRSGGIFTNKAPIFYIGILTFVAVLLFALNEAVPVRLKVSSVLIATLFHVTCCSSFINEAISIFGVSATLISSRLIGLEILLFFIAGIGLKNIKSVSRGGLIASCLIPMCFLIASNNSGSNVSLASPIIVATFLGIIGEALLVRALAYDKMSHKAKTSVLVAVFILVGVNAMFIMFNNSISKTSTDEYFSSKVTDGDGEILLVDKDLEIPVIGNGKKYMIIPTDLRDYRYGDSEIDDVNYLSRVLSEETLFEEITLDNYGDGKYLRTEDSYVLDGGEVRIEFQPVDITRDERLFVYCDAAGGAGIEFVSQSGNAERNFAAPFFTEINSVSGNTKLSFIIESEAEEKCRIAFFRLNDSAYNTYMSASGDVDSDSFNIDVSRTSGICTLILPGLYECGKIAVDGTKCEQYSFLGNVAIPLNVDDKDSVNISVNFSNAGLIPGILISSLSVTVLIAIPLVHGYNNKKEKKVSGEGTDPNA